MENPKAEPTVLNEESIRHVEINKSTILNSIQISPNSRKLLCIVYPGIVNNVDKMIETLGGIHAIELASIDSTNRLLELKFRPDDIYCKPCRADKDLNKGILVKIIIRQPKMNTSVPSTSKTSNVNLEERTTYRYELIGVTSMNFTFNRMCDFQYLPLVPTEETETKSTPCKDISKNIIPDELPTLDWFLSKESESVPLFFPPACYIKFNKLKNHKLYFEKYEYYENILPDFANRLKKEFESQHHNFHSMISRTRIPRKYYSQLVNFNSKNLEIPTEPHKGALKTFHERGLEDSMKILEKLFEERPIWPKLALLHKSGIREGHLKLMLPCIAYHCKNGPWRALWCKLGYDPREDPKARIYQSFDFRIHKDGLKTKVKARRSYSSHNYSASEIANTKFSLNDISKLKQQRNSKVIDESFYIMKPDVLPVARQIFYQYCDLHIKEIQDMLSRLPEGTKHLKYNNKNGWMPAGFHEQCREILMNHLTKLVKNILLEEKKDLDEANLQKSEEELPECSQPQSDEDDLIIVLDEDDNEEPHKKDAETEDDEGESDEEDEDVDNILKEVTKIVGTKPYVEGDEQGNSNDEDDDEEFESLYREIVSSNDKYLQ